MATCKCTKNGRKICKNRSGRWRFVKGKCRGRKSTGRKAGRRRKGRKASTASGKVKGKLRLSCTCRQAR